MLSACAREPSGAFCVCSLLYLQLCACSLLYLQLCIRCLVFTTVPFPLFSSSPIFPSIAFHRNDLMSVCHLPIASHVRVECFSHIGSVALHVTLCTRIMRLSTRFCISSLPFVFVCMHMSESPHRTHFHLSTHVEAPCDRFRYPHQQTDTEK